MALEHMGWFGTVDQLLHFMRTVGADRDEDGQFLVAGEEGPMVGLGGQDVVVPASTVYFVRGQAAGLASGMRSTSYGMGIVVI
jgi:hypothetical protein